LNFKKGNSVSETAEETSLDVQAIRISPDYLAEMLLLFEFGKCKAFGRKILLIFHREIWEESGIKPFQKKPKDGGF